MPATTKLLTVFMLAACASRTPGSSGTAGSGGGPAEETGGSTGATGGRPGAGGKPGTGGGSEAGSGGTDAAAGGTTGTGGATASPDAGADGAARPDASKPPPAGNGFRHPGVLLNQAQIDLVKAKITAGEQPWKAAYDKAVADNYGSLTYAAQPQVNVECGPYSNPNNGCTEEANDSIAAYTQALLWALGGDEAHAKKAIEIMNGWSAVFKGHSSSNGPLQAAWYGALWPRAAELIRYTYGGWPAAEVDRFKTMLKTAYLPDVINGSGANGNWELSMIEASINIAVFLDDKATFDKAAGMWRKRVPAYFYLKSDGATPVKAPRGTADWGTTYYVDGLAQETCRDFLHTQLGFGAAINAAETALQQGLDLYAAESVRLRTTMEFHADLLLGKPPGQICGGTLNLRVLNTWQIAFNHYHDRMGQALPLTERLILEKARLIDPTYKHMSWETLTHAGVGKVGLE
jgi:hypothetical protein